MAIIHPVFKGYFFRILVLQNIFWVDIWIFIGVVVWYEGRTRIETPDVVRRPQRLSIMEILELGYKHVRRKIDME
jgi:hypothetical protein